MAKINPELESELYQLLYKVDECGKLALTLLIKGLNDDDVKKGVKDYFKISISTSTVIKITKAVLLLWGK